jgi:hypothetical protein
VKEMKDTSTIKEGDVTVTYTVSPMPEERRAFVEAAAAAFISTLIESSAFSTEDSTENQSRQVDY